MKNIKIYKAEKYNNQDYEEVYPNIYKYQDTRDSSMVNVDEQLQMELEKITDWNTEENNIFDTLMFEGVKYFRFKNNIHGGTILKYDDLINTVYVSSIVFDQEPEFEENSNDSGFVSQYPLEDILEKFSIYTLDQYTELNKEDKNNSYVEFASGDIENIKNVLSIVGKHVYNKTEGEYVKLIIE